MLEEQLGDTFEGSGMVEQGRERPLVPLIEELLDLFVDLACRGLAVRRPLGDLLTQKDRVVFAARTRSSNLG